MPLKALVNSKQNVLMPPGHLIKILKTNLFNMAAVSVKRSIHHQKILEDVLNKLRKSLINGTVIKNF